jgi:C-terminal processing protease CtpA/Prc
VAYSGLITLPEAVADSGKKIGYLSYLSFDADYDTELIDALRKLGEEGITDLILDLRVNGGGSVNSSILLASSILGSSYEGKIYATLDRHEKNKYDDSVCKLVTHNGTTALPSLNMPALWVIASNGTASASEMVIVGLDGLDVPVTVVGARTEGKNCGMDVIEKTFGSTTYSYAPITFLNLNAKGFNDYGEGIEPDIDINSYMSKSSREEIQYFARTFPMPTGDWGVTKKDLALFEAVMQICGKSVLDTEQSAAMQPGKLEVATSMTRAGEPLKLEHKRRVFGATLTADERERMRADE